MIIVNNEPIDIKESTAKNISSSKTIERKQATSKLIKKIGIMMKMPESNFSNGCVQQGIFIKQLLDNIGYASSYVSIEKKYKQIHDIHEPVEYIDHTSDLSQYQTFIFVSLNLVSPENDMIINNIKKHGIVCVNVLCGNLFILHQEEFVFGQHNILEKFLHSFYDEYWVLEMYAFMTEYIELITDKPTYLLPYVWNDTILKKYLMNHKLEMTIDYHQVCREKINILIFEPNMSIHKTSLIPLLIAEKYNKQYGNKLNKVYVFCGNEVVKNKNGGFIKSLSLYEEKKIESYGRLVMPSVIALIRNSNRYINVVVSHNIMNPLNFLHLELLSIDIPIIHNCKPFSENKLYYDDFTLGSAVDLVETVRTNYYINSKYLSAKYRIHKEFHPSNFERQQVYKSHVERLTGIEVDNEKKLGPAENLTNLFIKISRFIHNKKIETSLFYNGLGIIMMLTDPKEIPSFKKTLYSLNAIKNTVRVEVIYHGDVVDKDTIPNIQIGYSVDYVNISDEFSKIEDKPNVYMSCVFASCTKGVFVECGTLFVTNPKTLVDKYIDEEHNSLSFFPSHTRIGQLSSLDQDVLYKLSKKITPFPLSTSDFTSQSSVIFFDKQNPSCNKVLTTMCELFKINEYMVTKLNTLGLVCELNFDNDRSQIKTSQFLLGEVQKKFKGNAIHYENELVVCMNEFSTSNEFPRVSIDITENEIELSVESNAYVFNGKINGKRIPKAINKLL